MRSVRILNVHVRWQHPENDLTIFGRFHTRVPMIAYHFGDIFRHQRNARKRVGTIVRKVLVHLPRLAEIKGTFDQHGGRPKRLEHNDQMGEMELGLQIQLHGNIFLAIFRLPPRLFACARLSLVNDLTDPMVLQRVIFGFGTRVAEETFLLFQMRNDAEPFGILDAAR